MLIICVCSISGVYAQGCSDAGICSVVGKQQTDSTNFKKNAFEVGYVFGKGLEDVVYNNGFLAYSRVVGNHWELKSRITYNQASGSFGTLGRLGDFFLTFNYRPKTNKTASISPIFGIKVPLSASNFKINGIALPLDYQASLGTFDALLGLDYNFKKWKFDAALQLPIWQINANSYVDDFSASDVFPTTNLFRRNPDVLVRSTYNIHLNNEKWSFRPNLMAIYHTGNDTYQDVFGKRQTIENSKGVTINAGLNTDYNINANNGVSMNLAAPLLVRKIRPDGLTRAFVASLTYQHKF